MNTEQIAEFNRACAEYLGIDYSQDPVTGLVYFVRGDPYEPDIFDPYHDANDRNRVLEKMRVETMFSPIPKKWWCSIDSDVMDPITPLGIEQSQSMEAAQIACIAKVLGVPQ